MTAHSTDMQLVLNGTEPFEFLADRIELKMLTDWER
jgi:hypothetical protein